MTRYRRVLGLAACGLALVLLWTAIRSITRAEPVMAGLTALPTIVIDPGHGGLDGGAVTKDGGVVEKDINLAIGLVLRDIFTANGFDVVMIRDTDISIHDEGVTGTKKQKTSDLHNRLAIVNSHPDAIFLSIHQNKYSSSSSWGAQVFYSPNNPLSEQLAGVLQDDFISMLQPENKRKHKKAGKDLYLMHKAECPAVLVECGFLSNPAEAELLTETEYRSKVAFTIFCSVMRFLGLEARV